MSKCIEEQDWSYVVEALQRGRTLEAIVPGWNISLREVVLRDGMIELFRLEDFTGLDVDLVGVFSDLEVDNIDDLRTLARERALKLLSEQVRRWNTFYVDLEIMKENDFAVFVPDALNSRIRERRALRYKPHLYETYSTYYGLTVLITGWTNFKQAGVPDDISENLLSILGDMGDVSQLKSWS